SKSAGSTIWARATVWKKQSNSQLPPIINMRRK
ncbi:MAG: hypothetical protein ACI87H_001620, partial [Gammaproteobacteria bacterium]